MISSSVDQYFQDHLRGVRTAEETREILALIDQADPVQASRVAEFDNLLTSIAKKIPGLTIDLEKLLSGDPIETDPLISQGNLALLRLDAVYHQTYAAWTTSGANLHCSKRITRAEDPAKYSQQTEKHERTEKNYPPDTQLLNQIVNITLSAFRIQATLTHRRNQLKNPDTTVSRDATRSALSPPKCNSTEIIDHTESLTDQLDDTFHPLEEIKPFEADFALIRGINKLSPLKEFAPLVQSPQPEQAPGTADVPVGILHSRIENQIPLEGALSRTKASAPICTRSSEASSGANPATSSDLRTKHPRAEEPVVPTSASRVPPSPHSFSVQSPRARIASSRETIPLTNNEPSFHKRE